MTVSREQVHTLFNTLRKRGVRARQFVACCGSCAAYELAEKYPKGTPVVFTAGNQRDVYEHRKLRGYRWQTERVDYLTQPLYLSYGHARMHENDAEVAVIVVEVARELDLPVEWDGRDSSCVVIHPTKTFDPVLSGHEPGNKVPFGMYLLQR